jgi:uracil-DNA glycosylase family 4
VRWSEAQQAMLREMGLRLWLPTPDPGVAKPNAALVTGTVADPVEPVHAAPQSPPLGRTGSRPAAVQAAPARPALFTPVSGVADMDWPALRAAVVGCRACTLCDGRRQTVFGSGHPRAHWLIVGEAPGEQEDALGEPFVGESGQLLDRMLRALGLSRQACDPPDAARQVFIANSLKCRPPGNRNPTAQELAACQPYLERQITLVQPRVILAMGRFAVQTLLGSNEPLGRLRGRLHDWRGVPLVVTYHPAYLLRQPAEKARAWEDLCLAASCLAPAGGG